MGQYLKTNFVQQMIEMVTQTIAHLDAEGDLAAAWSAYEGTQTGPMGPFPPSDAKVTFDFGTVFRIECGKIADRQARLFLIRDP